MKIAIVGGGASGLTAAIIAARNQMDVTILERNPDCAKKLLITGNGRCNYWNEEQGIEHYDSKDKERLKEILTKENQEDALAFFDSLGIIPKIKNGYYYPYANQATSIKSAMMKELDRLGVKRINQFYVETIEKRGNKFRINEEKEALEFDRVILATGSCACPKTGSDGIGYTLAKQLGHSIIPVLPSLTQLKSSNTILKEWNGVRAEVLVSLYVDNHRKKEELGEIQFTKEGLSGICIFNLSGLAAKALSTHQNVSIKVNFCPWIKEKEELFLWFTRRNQELKERKVEDLLEGFLNYKLVYGLLKYAHLSKEVRWEELEKESKMNLVEQINSLEFTIRETNTFENAQVCSGGVPLSETNLKTMESIKTKDLYIVGELLDVDGDCGGYNLGFAWISGILAGKGVSRQ